MFAKFGMLGLVIFLIVACAPSHSAWSNDKDAWIGTSIYSHDYAICKRDCRGSLWSPGNKIKTFDRTVVEGRDKRVYITWIRDCRYSLLVSPDDKIVSWRYETNHTDSCYIF